MSGTHNCRIPGCDTVIRTRFLLCHKHWEMLPRSLQDRVNDEYRLRMVAGLTGDQTAVSNEAIEEAIAYVTEKIA